MFYIRLHNGLPKEVSNTYPAPDAVWVKHPGSGKASGWMTSRDCSSKEHADTLARYLTAMTGDAYLGCDEGAGTYPRYRVVQAPKVGDFVSKSFNGDSYPVGTVTKISPTWIVTTDVGKKFRRWKESGGWREQGRGFWMVKGHLDERNPHF